MELTSNLKVKWLVDTSKHPLPERVIAFENCDGEVMAYTFRTEQEDKKFTTVDTSEFYQAKESDYFFSSEAEAFNMVEIIGPSASERKRVLSYVLNIIEQSAKPEYPVFYLGINSEDMKLLKQICNYKNEIENHEA